MNGQYWAACYTHAQAEPKIRRGIEDIGLGAFLPSYARYFYKGKELREHRKALLTRYVFVRLDHGDDTWAEINSLEDGARILTNCGKPSRVSDDDMARLMLLHATGACNIIQRNPNGTFRKYEKRRRRPRAGKPMRNRAHMAMGRKHGTN